MSAERKLGVDGDPMRSFREIILAEMSNHSETWDDVVSSTMGDAKLDKLQDHSFNDAPITVWTKQRVYFFTKYDSPTEAASVSREPDGVATKVMGG